MQKFKDKNIKWWLGKVSFMVFFVVIGIFAYTKMDFLLYGIDVKASINQNENSRIVEIKGNAKNANHISLNGREIFIDKDGSFSEPLALLPGLSIVTINAEDKFGKTKEKKFEVIYEENTGVAIANEIINTN
jgi:hypothetical protein